jgi:hypothetical protein
VPVRRNSRRDDVMEVIADEPAVVKAVEWAVTVPGDCGAHCRNRSAECDSVRCPRTPHRTSRLDPRTNVAVEEAEEEQMASEQIEVDNLVHCCCCCCCYGDDDKPSPSCRSCCCSVLRNYL